MAKTSARQTPENQERDEVLKRMLKMKPKPHKSDEANSEAKNLALSRGLNGNRFGLVFPALSGERIMDEPKPPLLPVVPDLFTIPYALIEQWGEIPASEKLNFPLTRQDIDHLLLGLLRSTEAQTVLDQCLVEWSNGRLDQANTFLNEFRRKNADAQNSIRQLANAV